MARLDLVGMDQALAVEAQPKALLGLGEETRGIVEAAQRLLARAGQA